MNNENENVEMNPTAEAGKKTEVVPAFSSMDKEKVEFILPVGSFDIAGKYFNKVLLGQLEGPVRKKLGRPEIISHPGKMTTMALSEILDFPHYKFVDEKQERKIIARSMYSADRAACILQIRKVTKGSEEISQTSECGYCGSRVVIYTSPDEIETIPVGNTKYKKDETLSDWIMDLEILGHKVRMKLARGFEEEGLSIDQIRNVNDSTNAVLAACTLDFDGSPVDQDFYERLNVRITDAIMAEFIRNQPGPDMFASVRCQECNRTFDYGVEASDFLLPNVSRNRLSRRGGR